MASLIFDNCSNVSEIQMSRLFFLVGRDKQDSRQRGTLVARQPCLWEHIIFIICAFRSRTPENEGHFMFKIIRSSVVPVWFERLLRDRLSRHEKQLHYINSLTSASSQLGRLIFSVSCHRDQGSEATTHSYNDKGNESTDTRCMMWCSVIVRRNKSNEQITYRWNFILCLVAL